MSNITVALPICAPARQQMTEAIAPLQQKFGNGAAIGIGKARQIKGHEVQKAGYAVAEKAGEQPQPVAQTVDVIVQDERRSEWVERELLKRGYRVVSKPKSTANARLMQQGKLNQLPLRQDARTGEIVPWSDGTCRGDQVQRQNANWEAPAKGEGWMGRLGRTIADSVKQDANNATTPARQRMGQKAKDSLVGGRQPLQAQRPRAALPDKQAEQARAKGQMTAMLAAAAARAKQRADAQQAAQQRAQRADNYEVAGKNADGSLEATPASNTGGK